MKKFLTLVVSFMAMAAAAADVKWTVESSTLTYTVNHLLHTVHGTSHATRGKAICAADGCRFLAAAPVHTFGSGDTNRDLHMVETTRGAQFPMVTVSGQLPSQPNGDFSADIDVEFSGMKATYKAVPFKAVLGDGVVSFTGVVPAKLTDFNIPAPALLGVAIKNEIPVDVAITWKKAP